MIAPYQKIRVLGYGGMGEVWLVLDLRDHCYKALKLWKQEIAKQEMHDFVLHEAAMMKKLNHPGIPMFFELVELEGQYGIVMEWIHGTSLACYEKRIQEKDLLLLAWQLLDILGYLHQMGILFLDLKPDHMLVDAQGKLHLIDFGIAQEKAKQSNGQRFGTIGFAPSEQYEAENLDERCDIYAFGKTLLALHLQIHDGSLLPTITPEQTTLSLQFRNVISHCIEPDKVHRYASVQQIQAEVRTLLRRRSHFPSHLQKSSYWKGESQ